MANELEHLEPELRKSTRTFLERCEQAGLKSRILCTWRPPEDQAKKFRCTRSFAEIVARADRLMEWGRPDLAAILMNVGAQGRPEWLPHGHLTNAACGESKHAKLKIDPHVLAYSYAFDFGCFLFDGSYISDGRHVDYRTAGAIAESLGLEWLGNSKKFREAAHVQAAGLPSTKRRLLMVKA